MRNANGMGTVYKLQGNRRKPYVAKAPATWDPQTFKQSQSPIGYFATRKEACIALSEYLKSPYNIDSTTVGDVIDKVFERAKLSERSIRTYKVVYKKWIQQSLDKVKLSDLKLAKCQEILDRCDKSARTAKNVLRLIERYAFEYEFINRPFADYLVCKVSSAPKFQKNELTKAEIEKLHQYAKESDLGKVFLLYLYSGCRKDELYILKKENVFIDCDYPHIVTGVKTEAGKNRVIPIHSRVLAIYKEFLKVNGDFLIPDKVRKYFSVENTSAKYHLSKVLGNRHSLHELRHTFRSELDRVENNQTIIDKILGHKNGSIGQKVYTHKTIEELYLTVNKITFNIA